MLHAVVAISWSSFDSSKNYFLGLLLLAVLSLFPLVIEFQIKRCHVVLVPVMSDIPYGTFSVSSEICIIRSDYIIFSFGVIIVRKAFYSRYRFRFPPPIFYLMIVA